MLGSMLLSPVQVVECAKIVSAADFYRPHHQDLFTLITATAQAGKPTDAVAIGAIVASSTVYKFAPIYLHTCIEQVPVHANGGYYASIVRDLAVRRRLREAGLRIVQLTEVSDEDTHGLTERAVREVEQVRDSGQDDTDIPTISEFLGAGDDDYDWVVEGLLERGDRFVLTGGEGLGKSTLFRQMAVCIAAGLHPFTHKPIEPQRVLLIDRENSPTLVRRKIRPLVISATQAGHPVAEANLFMDIAPKRMNLLADKDLSALMRMVSAVLPDVVIIGPLYKLAPKAIQTDDEAAPVLAALDMVRERGACLILEAHAGHAKGDSGQRDWRPRGSSALLGWPEFGYGLRPTGENGQRRAQLLRWRGDRDERDWPEHLAAGGLWPWSVSTRGDKPVDNGGHDFGSGAFS